jgi:hypothetical protein
MIKIVGEKDIIITEDETIACPANPKWAQKMIQILGLKIATESEKLRPFLGCKELMSEIGYQVTMVKSAKEVEEIAKKLQQQKVE